KAAAAPGTGPAVRSGTTATTTHATELRSRTVGIQSRNPPTRASGWTAAPSLAIAPDDILDSAQAIVATSGQYAASGNSGGTWMAAMATYFAATPDAAPVAALAVSPSSGGAPLTVTVDASASTDKVTNTFT